MNNIHSKELAECLASGGWDAARRYDASNWIERLTSEGFTMIDAARDVLETFGGLKIEPVTDPGYRAYAPAHLEFDPVRAASGEFDRVDTWQQRLNVALSPIAESGGQRIILLADDDRVFRSSFKTAIW